MGVSPRIGLSLRLLTRVTRPFAVIVPLTTRWSGSANWTSLLGPCVFTVAWLICAALINPGGVIQMRRLRSCAAGVELPVSLNMGAGAAGVPVRSQASLPQTN